MRCLTAALLVLLSLISVRAQVSVPTRLTNGAVKFGYTGILGHYYTAESSTSLGESATWTPLKTNNAGLNGALTFTDAPPSSTKFYRVRTDSFVPPLVYNAQATATNFPMPTLPTLGNLTLIQTLPDPFAWPNDPFGSTRSTDFSDWEHHRWDIGWQIQNYEIGTNPPVSRTNMFASYSGGTLTVWVTNYVSGVAKTLTLTCPVSLPAGTGPFPAIIGMNSFSGSVNPTLLTNVAKIAYFHDQVTTYNNPQNTNAFFKLYGPGQNISNTGQYAAWAWGVSRIIDGLYMVSNSLPIKLDHIAVTGC